MVMARGPGGEKKNCKVWDKEGDLSVRYYKKRQAQGSAMRMGKRVVSVLSIDHPGTSLLKSVLFGTMV